MFSRLCGVLSLVGALLTGKARIRVDRDPTLPPGVRRLPSGELCFGLVKCVPPARAEPVHWRDENDVLSEEREEGSISSDETDLAEVFDFRVGRLGCKHCLSDVSFSLPDDPIDGIGS